MRAWATMRASGLHRDAAADVAQDTCAEVWRTFNLARGGASFEGFVQGRFVEAVRRASARAAALSGGMVPGGAVSAAAPPSATPPATASADDASEAVAPPVRDDTRLLAALTELRARNPRHARAIERLYQDEATTEAAADELAVDIWAFKSMIARAKLALAQRLERPTQRPGQKQRSGDNRRPTARPSGKTRRPGRR